MFNANCVLYTGPGSQYHNNLNNLRSRTFANDADLHNILSGIAMSLGYYLGTDRSPSPSEFCITIKLSNNNDSISPSIMKILREQPRSQTQNSNAFIIHNYENFCALMKEIERIERSASPLFLSQHLVGQMRVAKRPFVPVMGADTAFIEIEELERAAAKNVDQSSSHQTNLQESSRMRSKL